MSQKYNIETRVFTLLTLEPEMVYHLTL